MLELLTRINKKKFDITCCFYFNYHREQNETIKVILQNMHIPVYFIKQSKLPKFIKIIKEISRILFYFNNHTKKKLFNYFHKHYFIIPNTHKIHALLKSKKFDILYMNNQPNTNIEGYLAAKDLNIKLIQHCRINPIINDEFIEIMNSYCHSIIAVSNCVYNTLLKSKIKHNLCSTVYNGIDINQKIYSQNQARKFLNLSCNDFILGSIGSLISRKSNHHILQSLSILKKTNPLIHWKLIILGDGPEKENLIEIAIKNNIINHIIFKGFVKDSMNYLSAFDVFITASKNEGLPRVVLEAMLAKTVIIGSNVAGNSELITHYETGMLFQYGNTYQLSQNIQILYYNQYLKNNLILFANQKVKKEYNIKNYISGIENIFLKY